MLEVRQRIQEMLAAGMDEEGWFDAAVGSTEAVEDFGPAPSAVGIRLGKVDALFAEKFGNGVAIVLAGEEIPANKHSGEAPGEAGGEAAGETHGKPASRGLHQGRFQFWINEADLVADQHFFGSVDVLGHDQATRGMFVEDMEIAVIIQTAEEDHRVMSVPDARTQRPGRMHWKRFPVWL